MRLYINKLGLIFLTILFSLSCSRESEINPQVNPVTIEIGADNQVSSLRIMSFEVNNLAIKGNTLYNTIQDGKINLEIGSGVYHFFFIANEPAESTKNALENIQTMSDLNTISFPSSAFNPDENIPMILSVQNVTVLPESKGVMIDGSNYLNWPVILRRFAVRFDVVLKSMSNLSGIFKGIQFHNLPDHTPLLGNYSGTHTTVRSYTEASNPGYFKDTTILGFTWAKKITRIILPPNEFSPVNQTDRLVGFTVLTADGSNPGCTFGLDEENADYTMPHNTHFMVDAVMNHPMNIHIDVAPWISDPIDVGVKDRSLNVSTIQAITSGTNATRVFFWTNQISAFVDPAGFTGTSGSTPFSVNDVFQQLSGAGAFNLHFNAGTGKGYFDLTCITAPSTDKSYRIYLNAGGLRREITVLTNSEQFYTITYDSQGGSYVPSAENIKPNQAVNLENQPIKDGSVFQGWNTQPDGSGTMYPAGGTYVMPGYHVTLYAQWAVESFYTVVFDSQGGSYVPLQTLSEGTSFIPGQPTKYGYVFTGWNTTADGTGVTFPPGGPFSMPNYDITLYAIWVFDEFAVTYDSQGGTYVSPGFYSSDDLVIASNASTRVGYVFVGWNTQPDGSGILYVPGNQFVMPANDLTLYAIWNFDIEYTLTFDSQGGSYVAPITGDAYTQITILYLPTRLGYTFKSWNDSPDGLGNTYIFGDNYTFTSDATLYAIWEPS